MDGETDNAPDLRDVLGSAYDEHAASAPADGGETERQAAPETTETSAAGAARDESGRFKAAEPAAETAAPADAAHAVPEPIAAPDDWKAGDWSTLPRDVQAAIRDREAAASTRFAERDAGAREWDAINQRLAAHEAQLSIGGTSKQQFLSNMIATHEAMIRDPATALPIIARMYGVDIATLAQQAAQQQPQADPVAAYIDQRIAPLQQHLAAEQQRQTVQQAQALQSQIDTFAADPANPHFGEVRQMMGALIQGGQAKDLRDAYDMACRAHPAVAARMADAARQADAQRQAREAEAARRKSGSITGTPVSHHSSASDSLRGTIEAAFDDA